MKIKTAIILFVFCFIQAFSFASTNYGVEAFKENTIDAQNNARYHNNLGNVYFKEQNYIAALKEYEIAFNLSYESNISASYLYNIARCYMTLRRFELAQKALLGVIKKDCMNLTYYDALVDCFINLKSEKKELEKYSKDTINPYNKIIVGLIYLKTGNKRAAKTIFDDFISSNPNMLISDDVRKILNSL